MTKSFRRSSMDLALVNVDLFDLPSKQASEALGIKDGKIEILGSEKEVLDHCNSDTKVINGNGRPLIPGFNDSHTHFAGMGVQMSEYIDLGTVPSKAKLLQKVKK